MKTALGSDGFVSRQGPEVVIMHAAGCIGKQSRSATALKMANFGRINAAALKIIIHLFFLMSNLMLVFALH